MGGFFGWWARRWLACPVVLAIDVVRRERATRGWGNRRTGTQNLILRHDTRSARVKCRQAKRGKLDLRAGGHAPVGLDAVERDAVLDDYVVHVVAGLVGALAMACRRGRGVDVARGGGRDRPGWSRMSAGGPMCRNSGGVSKGIGGWWRKEEKVKHRSAGQDQEELEGCVPFCRLTWARQCRRLPARQRSCADRIRKLCSPCRVEGWRCGAAELLVVLRRDDGGSMLIVFRTYQEPITLGTLPPHAQISLSPAVFLNCPSRSRCKGTGADTYV